jgi:hypothetical protein
LLNNVLLLEAQEAIGIWIGGGGYGCCGRTSQNLYISHHSRHVKTPKNQKDTPKPLIPLISENDTFFHARNGLGTRKFHSNEWKM